MSDSISTETLSHRTSHPAATINLPKQVTAAAFNADGSLLAIGSDDGCIRFYNPPDTKVKKAIRGLGASVSSVAFNKKSNNIWIASGPNLLNYSIAFSSPVLIYTLSDASYVRAVGSSQDDTLNQIALSFNDAYLACVSETGIVRVMDLSTKEVAAMKTGHDSIAWVVSFIPDRPNELLSGGYDCTLLHFDFKQRTVLSRFEIPSAPPMSPGISSLPPFITSIAMSPSGVLAVGTADGRIWIGLGGEKLPPGSAKQSKRKKSKKWNGLNEDEILDTKVADWFINGLAFISPTELISCSLYGIFTLHQIVLPDSNPSSLQSNVQTDAVRSLNEVWKLQSDSCLKVDILAYSPDSKLTAVGGLDKNGDTGITELWKISTDMSEMEADGE